MPTESQIQLNSYSSTLYNFCFFLYRRLMIRTNLQQQKLKKFNYSSQEHYSNTFSCAETMRKFKILL